VKFEATVGFELPDLRRLVGHTERLPRRQLRTAYFDTVDLRLWGRGITLRHRIDEAEGDGEPDGPGIWTLKLPVEAGRVVVRDEHSWPGTRSMVPTDAAAVVRGLVRRRPLVQLTELATTRQRLVLHAGDRAVAEVDDDTVVVVGGPRDGYRFRQVELELAADAGAIGDVVTARLEEAGAPVRNVTKLAVALGLADQPSRQEAPTVPPGAVVSLGAVVQSAIRSALDRLVDHDWRLRAASPAADPHDVHQARVATRRLRSDLKTFRAVLDPVWVGHARADLQWVGTILGAVRDTDVLAAHLHPDALAGHLDPGEQDQGTVELRGVLGAQRRAAVDEMTAMLDTDRYLDLLDRLEVASNHPPFWSRDGVAADEPAADVLPGLVGSRWQALRKQVRRAGREPSDRQLHQIRIKAKQLRYAAEAAAPTMGGAARRTAAGAEDVQTVLGHHHDAVAAEAWLREQVGAGDADGHADGDGNGAGSPSGLSTAAAFSAGQLAAQARQDQRTFRRQWRTSWKAMAKPKRRRWLSEPFA